MIAVMVTRFLQGDGYLSGDFFASQFRPDTDDGRRPFTVLSVALYYQHPKSANQDTNAHNDDDVGLRWTDTPYESRNNRSSNRNDNDNDNDNDDFTIRKKERCRDKKAPLYSHDGATTIAI